MKHRRRRRKSSKHCLLSSLRHVSHLRVKGRGTFRYWNVNRTAAATLAHFRLPKARIYPTPPAEICKWHATPSDTISRYQRDARVDNIYRREINGPRYFLQFCNPSSRPSNFITVFRFKRADFRRDSCNFSFFLFKTEVCSRLRLYYVISLMKIWRIGLKNIVRFEQIRFVFLSRYFIFNNLF